MRGRGVARLAARQHGVVGRQQLLQIGFDQDSIKRWLRAGHLHRLHREAFAVGHTRLSQRGHWLAAVLACGEGALLSHSSAAALWGLERPRGSRVDVTAPGGRQFLPGRHGIRLHRCRLRDGEGGSADGIPVTTVARTIFDLAESVDFGRLQRAWEEADRLRLLELRKVEQVVESGYGRRALRPVRRLLAEARTGTITRSALEDRFSAFCRDHRLPAPATNIVLLGFEIDACWPTHRLVVELDGFAYHRHRAAFERDRARDSALQAAGYRVVRLTHRRLEAEAGAVAAELRRMLSSGGGG
jgi:very-short-patch-repair endonuclease